MIYVESYFFKDVGRTVFINPVIKSSLAERGISQAGFR